MPAFPSPERLARAATRHPWLVVGAWVVVLVAALASASSLGDVLTTKAENYQQKDAYRALDLQSERLYGGVVPGREVVVIRNERLRVDDPAFQALTAGVAARLRGLTADVASVATYGETGDPAMVSADRKATVLPVTLTGDVADADKHARPLLKVLADFDGKDGYTVVSGGDGSIAVSFTETSEKDLQTAEMIGMPIALVVLAVVFGALVAAGLPLLIGLFSIAVALGVSAALGRAFDLSVFVTNMISMMGLAVGIDYSLLIIQRFREERRRGLDRDAAIIKAGGTASRAVLFSGMAVVVALTGMLLVPNSIFRSLGAGAIAVVVIAVLASLTLLPAMLRLLGDRVNKVRIRIPGRKPTAGLEGTGGFWDAVTGKVMRHPVISVVASVGLLVAAALPYFTIELGWAGVSSLPADSEAKRAYEILGRDFSAGLVAPADVVVDTAGVPQAQADAAAARLAAAMKADGRFGEVTITNNEAHTLQVVSSPITSDPQGSEARAVVEHLRGQLVPAAYGSLAGHAFVGGQTAQGADDTAVIDGATLPVFAFVLGLSFLILLVVFRSIVVPLKAIVMNLLSVGAAYGLMVLVFQHGFGADLLGFHTADRIESWVPLFMFAVLFGLSMDYHVFLLTRIRERFDHTHNNKESVAYGVRTTAGMITGAALIMVAVFSGFALGELTMFEQMGFGLAVAVLLDATIVRCVLVPASMELLGDRNWYFPAWLGWLPKVDVEGARHLAPPVRPALAEGAVGQ